MKRTLALLFLLITTTQLSALGAAENDVLFCIGTPDAYCSEFALVKEGYAAFPKKFPNNVRYEIGKSSPEKDWAFLHPTKQDESWAKGGPVHPFTIVFASDKDINTETALIIGYVGVQGDLSDVNVRVNETALPTQLPQNIGNSHLVFSPKAKGKAAAMVFKIPAGTLHKGSNEITITLVGKSWILYDYVALRQEAKPLTIQVKPEKNLLAEFRNNEMKDVKKIVFTTRTQSGEHWYANFGTYAHEEQVGKNPPAPNEGGKLCLLDLDTKQTDILIGEGSPEFLLGNNPKTQLKGLVRDPCVHYDGKRILFSYKPEGTNYFHLYEIGLDDEYKIQTLRQITDGLWDDIEPVYTPDDKIVFVSSRGKRWVNCWLTQVAILYGCDLDGSNIHALSGNIEQDNTPWFLPDGRVLYMRWEYIDRSQVHYHHLWTMNPDGTRQMVFFGNMYPGWVYIDAKPIPNSEKIVASLSPGHGRTEHAGFVGVIDPRNGPDDQKSAVPLTETSDYCDPWAFSENAFMAAHFDKIELIDNAGNTQTLFRIPKEWQAQASVGKVVRERSEVRTNLSAVNVHEPRPLIKRQRELVIGKQTNAEKATGELTLMDVYHGRNMEGVKRGDIKKLLVVETLPMPIHYTGGMEPMSYGGTFTLERIVGTVPVDADGSAKFDLPALRSFLFVALDEKGLAVKRMQSFVSVMPGERTSCVGCHEERTETAQRFAKMPTAMGRESSPLDTQFGSLQLKQSGYGAYSLKNRNDNAAVGNTLPDVIDYPRDIQPIWDKHCVSCHNPEKRDGHLSLSGNRGPMYSLSYSNIMARTHSALDNKQFGKATLVADGRNRPQGNYPPRTLGSGASALFTTYCQKGHYGVELSERERMLIIFWIETGAAYLGTYAGLGTGMLGGYMVNTLDRSDLEWSETKAMQAALQSKCAGCHTGERQLPMSVSDEIRHTWWVYPNGPDDSRRKYSRHLFFDLTQPEKSALLLAALSKEDGGYGLCMQAEGGAAEGEPVGGAAEGGTVGGGAAEGGTVGGENAAQRSFALRKGDENYKAILLGVERAKARLDEVKRFDMPGFIPRWEYLREMKRFGVLPEEFDVHTKDVVDYYGLDQDYWRSLWYVPQ